VRQDSRRFAEVAVFGSEKFRAQYFGTGSYSAVNWSCRAIAFRMVKEKQLRDRLEKIAATIHQLQI